MEPQTIIETESSEALTKNSVNTTTAPKIDEVPATVSQEPTTSSVKYGDSVITKDTNSKFIQAVVAKYGIEANGLVCTYDINGKDNNYVFQFDGSKDGNGKLIRTGDTLKFVYSVTADCKTICRTGGYTGNDGCSLANGLGVFLLSKQALIPNIQDQINAD